MNNNTPTRKERAFAELKKRSLHVAILFGAALLFTGAAFLFLREPKADAAMQQEPEGYLNGYRYVDLGLSVKWAEASVGADAESLTGSLFAWGEIERKAEYTSDNYNAPNEKLRSIERKRLHDAATDSHGRGWRMPTKDELKELSEKCSWEMVVGDEGCGYKVTGVNGNSIFISAECLGEAEPTVALWSSYAVEEESGMAYALLVDEQGSRLVAMPAYRGLQVRGVTK